MVEILEHAVTQLVLTGTCERSIRCLAGRSRPCWGAVSAVSRCSSERLSPGRPQPQGEPMLISGTGRKRVLASMAVAVTATLAGRAVARDDRGISQSGEQRNMRRVGHVDLQGRPSYQPNVIVYPDGRTIAFAGTHGGSKPNPLKPGSPVELNGVMIIDATNPARPVEKFNIPVPV